MHYSILYTTALRRALRDSTDLSLFDAIILDYLKQLNCPVHYAILHGYVASKFVLIAWQTFTESLNRLIANNFITHNKHYQITERGINALARIDAATERIVKAQIIEYADMHRL